MADTSEEQGASALELAAELTIAWLGNPNVRAVAEDVPAFLKSMHAVIGELSGSGAAAPAEAAPEYVPAVPVRNSVKPDHIVSLIDGKKLKSLKRHLSSHGLTPSEYRERYGLKPDYPMVAASYSAQRREVAKKLGLGRKPGETRAKAAESAAASATPAQAKAPTKRAAAKPKAAPKAPVNGAAPAKRGRAKKADAPAA